MKKKTAQQEKQPDQRWRNYSSVKLSKKFAKALHLISAITGETMITIADRLVMEEWEKVKDKGIDL